LKGAQLRQKLLKASNFRVYGMPSVDSDRREGEEEGQMELISFICKN